VNWILTFVVDFELFSSIGHRSSYRMTFINVKSATNDSHSNCRPYYPALLISVIFSIQGILSSSTPKFRAAI
jgi:hypothetical protein